MKRILLPLVPTILVLYLVGTSLYEAPERVGADETAAARVVSLAPSVTEVLFALGLGGRVVGVTDWCRWPAEASALPSVGGHVDPNLEAVLALRPDLVVVEKANGEVIAALENLGQHVLTVEHRSLDGVLASVEAVGAACGAAQRGAELRADLRARLDAVAAGFDAPTRALVIVGRDVDGGRLRDIYAAGRGTFLDELLTAAGGLNACDVTGLGYPTLSYEAVAATAPAVILDLAPEYADDAKGLARLRSAWQALGTPASRAGRVHVLVDDGLLIPGPRVVETVETFARALHPEPSEATSR